MMDDFTAYLFLLDIEILYTSVVAGVVAGLLAMIGKYKIDAIFLKQSCMALSRLCSHTGIVLIAIIIYCFILRDLEQVNIFAFSTMYIILVYSLTT